MLIDLENLTIDNNPDTESRVPQKKANTTQAYKTSRFLWPILLDKVQPITAENDPAASIERKTWDTPQLVRFTLL